MLWTSSHQCFFIYNQLKLPSALLYYVIFYKQIAYRKEEYFVLKSLLLDHLQLLQIFYFLDRLYPGAIPNFEESCCSYNSVVNIFQITRYYWEYYFFKNFTPSLFGRYSRKQLTKITISISPHNTFKTISIFTRNLPSRTSFILGICPICWIP